MRKQIMERITPKVDWRKVMRYFVKTSQRSERKSTPKRLNKRFPHIHPGKRVKRNASIAISIDQSGSVDDAMLAAFYSELNKLSSIATFTVIPFDDQGIRGEGLCLEEGRDEELGACSLWRHQLQCSN
jgi:predicted metal-dependent peptidase